MERKVTPLTPALTENSRSRAASKDLIDKTEPLECAVCLQTCIHPVQVQNNSFCLKFKFNTI